MKIKNILVSQPSPAIVEKSPFYEISTKYNAKIEYNPFIRVEGVTLKEFRSQRIEILDHSAIVFTSRTTIDNFFRICDEARITIPEGMKYLCNTEAVALYLQKYIVYRKRKIFFANGTFPNFMELILKHKDEQLLLTLSEPHKPELPITMQKLKLNFNEVILSRTVSCELTDLNIHKYDLLVFYSPSEIASLVAKFGNQNLPLIATFGDGTTRAAVNAGIPVNVMAPTPLIPSMAKAIDMFISQINAGEKVAEIELADNKQAEDFVKAQEAKPVKKSRIRKSAAAKGAKTAKTSSSKQIGGKASPTPAAKPVAKSTAKTATKSTTKTTAKPTAKVTTTATAKAVRAKPKTTVKS